MTLTESLAPSTSLDVDFSHVKRVAYAFNKVNRVWVDVGALGRALSGCEIDKSNLAAMQFFGDHVRTLLLIDSVITSAGFTISAERSADKTVKFNVPAIKALVQVSDPSIVVSSVTGAELTFLGSRPLTFAFTSIAVEVSENGSITQIVGDDTYREARSIEPAVGVATHRFKHVMLSDSPAMVAVGEEETGV
jgi:hypothetical protein